MLDILTEILNLPVWSIVIMIVFSACCGMVIGLMAPLDTDEYERGREDAFRQMARKVFKEDKQ